MSVTQMTIGELSLSPFNARTNQVDANAITGMAGSLLSRGQLYPLVVHPIGKGKARKFGVLAGGRRYRAFAQLIEQGQIPADHSIDVIVRDISDEGELREMSLAENLVRVDLRPYEVFAAVARAIEHGRSLKDIADTNGQPIETVRKWARLGQLAPAIFKALEEGAIGQDTAQALAATEDHALQLHVFGQIGALPDFQRTPATIRKLLKVGDRELETQLRFVGEQAYRDAGGRYELDLYADEAQARGRVVDEGLLLQLAEAKLEAARETLRTRTGLPLRFEKALPRNDAFGGIATDLEIIAQERPLPPMDEASIDAQRCALEDIQAQLESESEAWDGDKVARVEALEAEAVAQLNAMLNRRPLDLPDGDVYATLTIRDDGNLEYRFWWADRKAKRKHEEAQRRQPDAPAPAPVSARPLPSGAELAPVRAALNQAAISKIGDGAAIANTGYSTRQNADAAIRDEHGLTQDGVQAMRSIRREMLRATLVEESDIGTLGQDYLIFCLARHALAGNYAYQLGAVGLHSTFEAGEVNVRSHVERTYAHVVWQRALDQLKGHPSIAEKDLPKAFRAWRDETEAWKIEAAAIVAGLALERSANAPGYAVPLHDLLFHEACSDHEQLSTLVDPTEELVDLMTKADRLKLVHPHVTQGEYQRLAKLKASELTAPVVRALRKVNDWVHPLLRFTRFAPGTLAHEMMEKLESQNSGKPEIQMTEAAA